MARKVIDVGAVGNDGTGDSIRESFQKVNENFRELYSSLGLGERLTLIGLDDTPATYLGNEAAVLAVNPTTDGVMFKNIVGGIGVAVDTDSNSSEISISTEFSEISGDTTPQLGGNLSARSGGVQYRIQDLVDPVSADEAARKGYVDTKISRAGVDGIDPATGNPNSAFGSMTGPLVLARDPIPEDDEVFGGLIAATKNYVDSSAFGSKVNLYVATSGRDERPGVSEELQGRALAYAYKTLEAALKRAEEIILDSQNEIGPYKKILTYNNGANDVTLAAIETSPSSGAGFAGTVTMSVDTITLNDIGTNYNIGDIIELSGGTGSPARYEVLSTTTTPGPVVTFRQISSGSYTSLPGSTDVATTSDSAFGAGATFDVTYKVTGISITNGGSGYSLVSVRTTGGGATDGAFGTATVVGGEITKIIINDEGSGFTTLPTVVADLPRFLLRTDGQRTDFTGDVLTDTPVAFRTRDIREGLFIRGEESGALAQILAHEGALDSLGNEIFDMDIKYGDFIIGEVLSYGDTAQQTQITVKVETGIYEENYPLKVPQNVAIVGDEFRRVIIRPRPGTSSSPWAFNKFRRDPVIDGMTVADRLFGYHYLQNSAQPVYPKVTNQGNFTQAAQLVKLNKAFLQKEVVEWIDYQIANNIAPFTSAFQYDKALCQRDVGLIIDAFVFDLKYGEYNRTISAGLKYYQNASGRLAITTQLSETVAGIRHLESLMKTVVNNGTVTPTYNSSFLQVIDPAFIKENGVEDVITELTDALVDVMDGSGSVNYPKENDQMDVFLCNDAVILRAMTMQGHGGFSMSLDPQGQILAKSPYAQECASFSKSINKQTFAGGMFVDGFAGNLQFTHESSTTTTRIGVGQLDRFPQLPASFIVDDEVYRINYVRDFVYSPTGSTATFVLDETTPFTRDPGFQDVDSVTVGNPGVITKVNHRLQAESIVVFSSSGTVPAGLVAGQEYFVMEAGLTSDNFQVTEDFGSTTAVEFTSAGTGQVRYLRKYEVLMPGNRSMLSNDFTQVADMGYGLMATNGGLTEAVSMFTYYCYASYYSINGAQIRSVGGSSAHGQYALVAEGSDPLEVPTPVTLYYDLAQRVDCYFPSPAFANQANGLFVFVTNYDYTPLNNSELEVDHGFVIFRYPVTSVTTTDLPDGVARLNLTSDQSGNFDGLFAQIADGTVMTLRSNSQVILTGDIVDVATRPSTGLRLQEYSNVYRVLQFEEYSDSRGDREIEITTGDPVTFKVLATITDTDAATDIATFNAPHGLLLGDTIEPKTSLGGLTAGVTYHIIDVPKYDQVILSTTSGGSAAALTTATGLSLKVIVPHKLLRNYILGFTSTGTLPTELIEGEKYFVKEQNLTTNTFQVGESRQTPAIEVTTTGTGTVTAIKEGLAKTTLRENYDYVDLTVYQPSESVGSTGADLTYSEGPFDTIASISIASPGVINKVSHGLSPADVIIFRTTGKLPTGLNETTHFFVNTVLDPDNFTVSVEPPALSAAVEIDTTGTQSGTHSFAKVQGRAGDSTITVVPVAPAQRGRVPGSVFVHKGEVYVIDTYESEETLNKPFARITLNRPLEHSVVQFSGTYTIRSAVPIRSAGADGNLTIRISLTRLTSHDLLDIGTGSYADTNYPNEIYGPPVNAVNAGYEVEERDVGRVFYVTTDQFGNFRVGPYFAVDQGTGQVTFSAAIALSNLDGIGFKRGVPIAEFSTDSGMSDNAVDTVPTENATRVYIERRLGKTHSGSPVPDANLIPAVSGGFMALDGGLPMKGPMDMGANKIVNMADPVSALDAINLRSLKFTNLQDFTFTNLSANQLLVFTGVEDEAINVDVVGDIALNIDSTANTIDAQIQPDTILNADVNSTAGIEQSKLDMTIATTAASAPTGSADVIQAASGLVSFDDAQFTVSNGWVTLKTNGIPKNALAQVTARSVLGNNSLTAQNAADILFTDVVDNGGGIKKAQYTGPGVLNRVNPGSNTNDSDYDVVELSTGAAGYTASDADKLVLRSGTGDIGVNIADVQTLKVDSITAIDSGTTATGGFIQLYTFGGNGGIYLKDGSLAADKANQYWNDKHEFKTQNGLNNAPIVASSVETLALTTGGNTTSGTVTGRWTLTGSSPNESRFEATYAADLAEYYEGDKEYEVGTVLVFGGDKEVTTTNEKMNRKVAGVVSDRAAYVMYSACPGFKNLVALQGRVPVKVAGKIEKGDTLVTSHIPGVAIASDDPKAGTIIGKAIEAYDNDHIGTIEVAVGRQ